MSFARGLATVSRTISATSNRLGEAIAWLFLLMMALSCAVVVWKNSRSTLYAKLNAALSPARVLSPHPTVPRI